jgi:hypothetical protein
MKKTLALVAVLLLMVGCEKSNAWNDTCSIYNDYLDDGTDVCADLDAPEIVTEDMYGGLQGYYEGGDTIYIREGLTALERLSVIIHEMVHYIDVHTFGLEVPGYASQVCASEERAWFIEGVWWGMQGKPENARPDWWKNYPYCWEWYATDSFSLDRAQFMIYVEWIFEGQQEFYFGPEL